MSEAEKIINERLSDSFFRKYISRALLIVLMAYIGVWYEVIESGDFTVLGSMFILLNFVERVREPAKVEALAKLMEAAKP